MSSKSSKAKKTASNIDLKSYYGENPPGQYPFIAGIYPNMYQDRLWTMRQYAGFSSAYKSNKRYHYLLNQGVSGLSVAFDLPTQTGYDSDHELSQGEIGKVGVPISTIEDMRILLNDIPLDKVSISMTINSTAIILLAFLIVVAEESSISLDKIKGTVQNDILKEYIARGTYIYPPEFSMKLVTDIFEYCNDTMPYWNTISISGYHIREAGSNAVQELAFTFANAISYTEAAINKGLDINKFSKRMSFFFNSHNYFFEEIAKFRAARSIWSKIMKNRFNVTNDKGLLCRFHTQTAGSTLQAQQIDNNIIRTTMQATAAILGGTQSLHTNSKDEALSLPTEDSAKTALRTQQILAYETGLPDVVDPLAGSYYIESLTSNIENEVFALINKIDDLGGAIEAIEKEFQQNEIANTAFEYQQSVENKQQIIVGLNKYETINTHDEVDLHKIDQSAIDDQLKRLKLFKKKRDDSLVKSSLLNFKKVLTQNVNLLPIIIDCIKNDCTLGEICQVMREVHGEYF
ncbi:MAG: methylmalonyl-CoA mutase [Candidatus Marinimicrobia bacterium]|nr:methylmalonyl-CoA mutase [Candidatus Neomarinimicrobiota bacterium]|tara:strand:+ start:81865 stop:83415 length:1551 start_codon:yes stop_codon:yes gene_type:complete